uniref:Uncharacterized protein n=1 Tax=Anguilla anguilla TaxID=7936 RepID=A0A0E9TAX8_ANGAN
MNGPFSIKANLFSNFCPFFPFFNLDIQHASTELPFYDKEEFILIICIACS